MTDLFTYGSLMFPAVWQQLVPGVRRSIPAFLPHYSRRIIFLDTYPLLIADQDSTGLLGTVYRDLTSTDIERLDWFEGEIYQRVNVRAHTDEGWLECETYIPKPLYAQLARHELWRGDFFQDLQMPIFLQRYCKNNLPPGQ